MRAGADIGGTFTDVISFDPDSGNIEVAKILSSADLHSSVVKGLTVAGQDLAGLETLVHGSTVVINTLLERKGASTALVTTRGFRDVYEMGRINRPDSFNLYFEKHVPLIPRHRRYEVDERMLPDREFEPLDPASLAAVADAIEAEGAEAIAIMFLHSYASPEHEQMAMEYLRERLPGCFVSASHEVAREYREFERTSTVAANAYVGPKVSDYLERLEGEIRGARFDGEFLLMQSNGGLFDGAAARRNCIAMIESGPAGGVIGAQAVLGDLGLDTAVAFDMGGTTAKAGVVEEGKPRIAHEYFAGPYGTGLPIQTPVMDIHEVGTGGGSIAAVTEYGELRVGPHSAGSIPGPACYGNGGTLPTVTDANVVLNRLSASLPLAGGLALDRAAARAAVDRHVGEPLGLTTEEAADAIIRVANVAMSYAISAVTVERGLDPASFTLVAYGGAGPLHATQLARELRIGKVVIPVNPGVFSAYGMLFADLERHVSRTRITPLEPGSAAVLRGLLDELAEEATDEQEGQVSFSADMRYRGQEHSVPVPLETELFDDPELRGAGERFHSLHEQIYSHSAPDEPVEFVTVRAVHRRPTPKPDFPELTTRPRPEDLLREAVWLDGVARQEVPFLERSALGAGAAVQGPAIVAEPTSATVLMAGDSMTVHPHGHLLITVGEEREN